MAKKSYDEDAIRVLKGLSAVRSKPALYIGPPDAHGIFTILREVGDNCVDEYLADSGCSKMSMEFYSDGSVVVADDGPGIPVGTHKTEGISTLEVAVGMLHAGGKLDEGSTYEASRGTHGIGVSATNALSESFEVWTCRDGQWHYVAYKKGELKKATSSVAAKVVSRQVNRFKRGTVVRFKPDMTIFDEDAAIDMDSVHEWASMTAYLAAGFTVSVWDEDSDETWEYVKENGTWDWLDDTLAEMECEELPEEPFWVSLDNAEIALTFTDSGDASITGYCNGLEQVDGGIHVDSTVHALYKTLAEYAGARDKFHKQDVLEGVLGLVNFKIDAPRFTSQTKEKLADKRFDSLCYDDIVSAMTEYWKSNKKLARELCKRASSMYSARSSFTLQRQALRSLREVKRKQERLPGKLLSVKCDPEERELFLVEGESAQGTCEAARMTDPYQYQESLGLRGKMPNAYKTGRDRAVQNAEFISILAAIGYDPSKTDPLSNLRIGRLMLLSDPDPDGYHINTLMLSFLGHILPELLERGMVYAVQAPKFVLNDNGTQYFGMTKDEVYEQLPKRVDRGKMSYVKGFGEMQAISLRQVAFNPETRRVIKIKKPSEAQLMSLESLMGGDASSRRELLGI